MLYGTVLVQTKRGSGSGTVIYSAERDGEIHTYILTNHHVVRAAITVREEWDSKKGVNIDVERRSQVEAYWFDYNDYSVNVGKRGLRANIVAYNAKADLALIRLVDSERFVTPVVPLIPPDDVLHLMEQVWAVGSGLGQPPFATRGEIAYLDAENNGYRYMMATAPIVWGNSGGALFRWSGERNQYELIGVPSRISIAGFTAVLHMAWSIHPDTIYGFLRDDGYCFIVNEPDCPLDEDDDTSPD